MNAQEINRKLAQLGFASTWGYIFFSVVPHAAAGKHISSGLMLLSFLSLLLRKQIRKPEFTWLNASVFLVVGLALLSAVLTPYAADSLNQFRKEGLPFLLGFLLLTNGPVPNNKKMVLYTMLTLMLGYAVKEILALWAGANNNFQFSLYELPNGILPKYLDFFSADTPYYLPFLLGPLFFWPMRLWQRVVLSTLTILAVCVVVVSGVRTAFIFVAASVIVIFIYRFYAYKRLLISMLGLLFLCGYLLDGRITNPSIARYSTITTYKTYKPGNDGSISERYAIVKGVFDVSKDRLILGYGLGWKKLPNVAKEKNLMQRWAESEDPIDQGAFRYFSYGEGKVNPHNLYASLLFENGLLGLVAYLLFIIVMMAGVLRLPAKKEDPLQLGFAVAAITYLVIYCLGGLAGGSWLPVNVLVIVTCIELLQREKLIKSP